MHLEKKIQRLEKELLEAREECKQSKEIIVSLTKTLESVTSSKEEVTEKLDKLTSIVEMHRTGNNHDLEEKLKTALKKQEELQKEIDSIRSTATENSAPSTDASSSTVATSTNPFITATTANNLDNVDQVAAFLSGVAIAGVPPIQSAESSTNMQSTATSATPITYEQEFAKFLENVLPEDPKYLVKRDTKLNKDHLRNEDVITKMMSINSKPEKQSKSIEEIRLEYYLTAGKAKKPSKSTQMNNNGFYKYDKLYNLAKNLKLHMDSTDHRQNQGCRLCGFPFLSTSSTAGSRQHCPQCLSVNIVGTLSHGHKWFMCNDCSNVQQEKIRFYQMCNVCRRYGTIIDISHLTAATFPSL